MLKTSVKVTRKNPGFQKKLRSLTLDKPRAVKVGLPKGAAKASVIERAIFNEFGTRHIPARPALRNAVKGSERRNRKILKGIALDMLKSVASPTVTAKDVTNIRKRGLAKVGALLQGDMQSEITALRSPANAPSTIKRKKSENPLIASGEYRQAITWKLED